MEDFDSSVIEYLKAERGLNDSQIREFIHEYTLLDDKDRSRVIYEIVGKELYKENPVDIETFIFDPYFLGNIYGDIIFPMWVNVLKEIYPAPFCKKYNEVLLSCATRSGKSTIAVISALYELYLLLCMISPSRTLNIKNSANICFIFLSKDNPTACSQLGEDMHKGLTLSPYFTDVITNNLSFSNLDKKGVQITNNILLKAGSSVNVITGTDLLFGVLDEYSYDRQT